MRNYQGRGKRYQLIILHIAKTEFNNCFIIHLFILYLKFKLSNQEA